MSSKILHYGCKVIFSGLLQSARLCQQLDIPNMQAIIHRLYMSFALKAAVVLWKADSYPIDILAECIQGGCANVYRAERNGKIVAIKAPRMYANSSANAKNDMAKTLIHELAIMVLVGTHPNIMPTMGMSTYRRIPCLVFPWMTNGTSTCITEHILRLAFFRMKIAKDIVKGMVHLKRAGVVHGDLKNSNILIDDSGNAIIADFGLAVLTKYHPAWFFYSVKQKDDQDSPDLLAGTLRWMAPELIIPESFGRAHARPTFESDIFALGMVIYEIYSGMIPYHEDNNLMAISRIITGQRPQRPGIITDTL